MYFNIDIIACLLRFSYFLPNSWHIRKFVRWQLLNQFISWFIPRLFDYISPRGWPLEKVFVHPKKNLKKIQKIQKKSKKSKKFGRKKIQNPRKREKIRKNLQKSPKKVQKVQKSWKNLKKSKNFRKINIFSLFRI